MNIAKWKETHRSKEQTSRHQWGKGSGGEAKIEIGD